MFRRWMKKPRAFIFQQAMEVFSVVCLFGVLELQNWIDYNGTEIDLPNCMDEILQVPWPKKPLLLQVQTIRSKFETSDDWVDTKLYQCKNDKCLGLLSQPWLFLKYLIRVGQFVDKKICKLNLRFAQPHGFFWVVTCLTILFTWLVKGLVTWLVKRLVIWLVKWPNWV